MDRFDAMALMVPDLNPKLREQFAGIMRQVAHDEREACAQLAERYDGPGVEGYFMNERGDGRKTADDIAFAIRNRNNS